MEGFWLVWSVLLFASVPVAVGGGVLAMLRHHLRPLVAVPAGVAIGMIAAPTFLLGSYIFLLGWIAAAFIWAVAGAWHRYVTDVQFLEIAVVIVFAFGWLMAGSVGELFQSGEGARKVAADGAFLTSPLVATLIVLEFSAASWDWLFPRRRSASRDMTQPDGGFAAIPARPGRK